MANSLVTLCQLIIHTMSLDFMKTDMITLNDDIAFFVPKSKHLNNFIHFDSALIEELGIE